MSEFKHILPFQGLLEGDHCRQLFVGEQAAEKWRGRGREVDYLLVLCGFCGLLVELHEGVEWVEGSVVHSVKRSEREMSGGNATCDLRATTAFVRVDLL